MATSANDKNDHLHWWFVLLDKFQNSASNGNTSVVTQDLLTFSKENITTVLPSATKQNQFCIDVHTSCAFDVSPSLFANYATFQSLLNRYYDLITVLGHCLQQFADAGSGIQNGLFGDFMNAKVSVAFPGGSGAADWKAALGVLTDPKIFAPACFSQKFQDTINKTVDDGTGSVSDLVKQIAGLG